MDMNATETDLELLEQYLDDELAVEQVQRLEQRLSAEPALSAALGELRQQRALCHAFFESLDDQASADRVVASVGRALKRQQVMTFARRSLRWVGVAAACVAVGLFAGIAIQNQGPDQPLATPAKPAGSAQPPVYHVSVVDESGRAVHATFQSADEARKVAEALDQYSRQLEQLRARETESSVEHF